jgi:hypothetical protein
MSVMLRMFNSCIAGGWSYPPQDYGKWDCIVFGVHGNDAESGNVRCRGIGLFQEQ